jgi:hypothetical protein
MTRAFSLALLCTALLAPAAGAQTVTRDPGTGDYRLTYTDLDGQTYTVVVEAADKVDPRLEATVEPAGDGWRYRYSLANRPTERARSPILAWSMPCPVADATLRLSAPPAVDAMVLSRRGACDFGVIGEGLAPGAAVDGLVVESAWLPAIVEARVVGAPDFVAWPSVEGAVPEAAYRLADEIQGGTGGWYAVPVVGPGRDPAAPPEDALDGLLEELAAGCDLAWITSDAVCHSLRVKLSAARDALARSDVAAARGQLRSVLAELDAQHGTEPGKHVGDPAHAVLGINVRQLLSRLQATSTRRPR